MVLINGGEKGHWLTLGRGHGPRVLAMDSGGPVNRRSKLAVDSSVYT